MFECKIPLNTQRKFRRLAQAFVAQSLSDYGLVFFVVDFRLLRFVVVVGFRLLRFVAVVGFRLLRFVVVVFRLVVLFQVLSQLQMKKGYLCTNKKGLLVNFCGKRLRFGIC